MQPASYCDDYPVTNYSLEVTEVRVGEDPSGMIFTSMENPIKAENLSDDAIYVFRLSATNSVGTVSTNLSQEICEINECIYHHSTTVMFSLFNPRRKA